MFRDLARMTAMLKGPRYDGALIGKAIWERKPGDTEGRPCVLRDQHGLLEVMAADDSGRLTLVMLLGHEAPVPAENTGRAKRPLLLKAKGLAEKITLSFCFTADDVHAFVRAAGDTNPLHLGREPLVPGLEILEAALEEPALSTVTRAELRFHGASFAGETIEVCCR